jgi:hypothetical protein
MRYHARAALDAVALLGFLGWMYVAAVAAFRPDEMTAAISVLLPVRRDTFGAACFLASAVAAFLLQVIRSRWWEWHTGSRPGPLRAALRTVAGYGIAAWAYLCLNSLTHPRTVAQPFVHFCRLPTEGAVANGSFLVSGAAFYALRVGSHRAADRTGRG